MTSTRKKITTIFFLASLFGLLLAQSGSALAVTIPGTAQWAHSTEVIAPGGTEIVASSTDSSGNIYAVGFVYSDGTYNFGNGVEVTGGYGIDTDKNAVIVKYNSAGAAQWARSTGEVEVAPSDSEFLGVSVDSDGNIYAVGRINGNAEFDFGGDAQVTGAGVLDNAVIVKYDSEGVAEWAKSTVAAPDVSEYSSVSVDSDGNIYAVGNIVTGLDESDPPVAIPYGFGNGVTVTGGYDVDGGNNPVIVKYDSSGIAQWAKSTEDAPAGSSFSGVSVDSSGNIYAVGRINGNTEFDFGGAQVTGGYDDGSGGGLNAIIVKYEPTAGDAQWAKSTDAGAPNNSYFSGVSVDPDGNIYAVGNIVTGLDESDPPVAIPYGFGNGVTVTGGYGVDHANNAVIVKYEPTAGDTQWAKSTTEGAPGASGFYGVSVDSSGNIYAVGRIRYNYTYGFGNDVTVTGGFDDGYNAVIVKYAGETPVIPVTPELPYTGGQTSSLASTGQPLWLLLISLAGFASIVSGFVLTRKRAKA